MTLGALAFLNPWLLAGLAALPIIYWLLRTVPPRPRQIAFPPTRILVGLENPEKTPHKTPWWLMLIRLLAAALVILALAEPVLNPDRETALKGSGPVVIVVDNGWSAAAHWAERTRMVDRLIDEAEATQRSVVIAPTATAPNAPLGIEAPKDARVRAGAMLPEPYSPDRDGTVKRLRATLSGQSGVSIIWLSDGVDHGAASVAVSGFEGIADAGLSVVEVGKDGEALGAVASVGKGGALNVKVLRADGAERSGVVAALSVRGDRLGEARFQLGVGQRATSVSFSLPLELRNQVSRVAIETERSSGAVSLLDARSQWNRIGLLSGTAREEAQPLLDPLYYIRKAVGPFAELTETDDSNLAAGVKKILSQKPAILILADIGTLAGETASSVNDWVQSGGVLVRFAGPRLEKGGDTLLPVPLRIGGRELGGALSWSTPQPLAAFGDESLFAGLEVPKEVLVRRQVLADPTRLGPGIDVWARLKDGTPLVTSAARGDGRIVLFHVTGNSNWSNLPLSGLFVSMLRRLGTLGKLGGGAADVTGAALAAGRSGVVPQASQNVLPPVQVLDGFGALRPPPPTAQPIGRAAFDKTAAQHNHPPGYYGAAGRPRALNVITETTELKPLPSLPTGVQRRVYEGQTATPLKPWFLGIALALLFIDIIAVLLLQSGGLFGGRQVRGAAARAGGMIALFALAGLLIHAGATPGFAQNTTNPPAATTGTPKPPPFDVARALKVTGRVTLGYVMTGDPTTDGTSAAGLSGLGRVLTARTAVEPGEPVGVNIERDEIAFFPILYWPVSPQAQKLKPPVLAKIDAYMKQGGMIIFDTKDFGTGVPVGFAQRATGNDETPLQRLLSGLDIPRLEPVAEGHVLTKSFYLLRSFPGRWDGGQLWVEAGGASPDASSRASRVDGVSSILVTSNDFASAWALDDRNLSMFPVVPGGERQREMSYRTGINIVMYALTGNYKADQVHIPALLERLGQ